MQKQVALTSTQPTGNTPAVSLRARSSFDLTQAILSPSETELAEHRAFTADRARVCLKLFYDPDMVMHDRAEMLDLFAKALTGYPTWAVSKGFDDWEKTMQRRPSPAEIGILASRAVKTITDELALRKKQAQPEEAPREMVDKDAATEIMLRAGFTPRRMDAVRKAPLACTIEEAEAISEAPPAPHWSESVTNPDTDPRMIALRAARAASTVVKPSPMVLDAAEADRRRMGSQHVSSEEDAS